MHWSDGDRDGFHYRAGTTARGSQNRTPRGPSATLTYNKDQRTRNMLIDTGALGVDGAPHPLTHSWRKEASK